MTPARLTLQSVTRPRALIAYVVIGVVIGLGVALLQRADRDGGRAADQRVAVAAVSPGARAPAGAVWIFGTRIVRVPPAGGSGGVLSAQGFGDVLGAPGFVNLFDPGGGTLARLDAKHNRLNQLAPVTVAPSSTVSPQPIADTGDALWLVTAPAGITRVALTGARTRTTVALAEASADAVTLTVADDNSVWAATSMPGATALARIDPGTGRITGRVSVPSPTRPVALVSESNAVVLIFDRSTVTVDASSLSVGAPRQIVGSPGLDIVAGVTAGRRLWVLDRSTARLLQLDAARRKAVRRIAVQGPSGPLRGPFGVAAAGGRVWTLAPADEHRFGAALVTGTLAASGRVIRRFTTPARLEAGAVAISTSDGPA